MYWNTFVSLRFLQKSCCNSNRNEACRFLSWNDEKAIERGKNSAWPNFSLSFFRYLGGWCTYLGMLQPMLHRTMDPKL